MDELVQWRNIHLNVFNSSISVHSDEIVLIAVFEKKKNEKKNNLHKKSNSTQIENIISVNITAVSIILILQ